MAAEQFFLGFTLLHRIEAMALTKEQKVDKIEIVGEYKHGQGRTATVVSEDGVEL